MRLILKQITILRKTVNLINKLHVKHYSKGITGDHVKVLNGETLTGRILLYLNKDKLNNNSMETTQVSMNDRLDKCKDIMDILKSKHINDLSKCNKEQVMHALNLLNDKEYVSSKYEFLKLLNKLDSEYCLRLNDLDIKEIFKILHTYMNIIPNRITEYQYYHFAVEELFSKVGTLQNNDLIQLIFYIGLQKNSAKASFMLRKCLKKMDIDELTTEEICIICNSTFKTSTKIDNKLFLKKIIQYLNDNLYLLKDPAIFITLIKTIRHNRFQNEDLLGTISSTVFFNKTIEFYSFSALCHILALYADYLYYDEALLEIFTKKCMEELKKADFVSKRTYLEEQPRAKDIKRFLWSLSNLNYKNLEENSIKDVIIPRIKQRIEAGEFKNDPGTLIEIILYLWMLNYRAYELVPYALSEKNVQLVRAQKSLSKDRLNLLLSCIYFEDHNLYKELNLRPQGFTEYKIEKQIKKRPTLTKIIDNLKSIAAQHDISRFKVGCQVPYINIVGITGYRKNIYKAVHIEILDQYTCLKNVENTPTGLMQLKLRLLEQCDEGLIIIKSAEVDEMLDSDSELQELLRDELRFVC